MERRFAIERAGMAAFCIEHFASARCVYSFHGRL